VVLADDVSVIFFDTSSQKLEEHDEEDDADARAGEHAGAADVPTGGKKACVDGVPVPEHLRWGWSALRVFEDGVAGAAHRDLAAISHSVVHITMAAHCSRCSGSYCAGGGGWH
jgi:hypothetical protein